MIGQQQKSRRIEYWKRLQIEPWATFDIVPLTVIPDSYALFQQRLDAIKAEGFSYRVIEVVETIVEER